MIVDWRRQSDLNVTTFSVLRRLEDALELVPCCVELSPRTDLSFEVHFLTRAKVGELKRAQEQCDTLYLIVRGVLNASDLGLLAQMITPHIRADQRVVVVARQLSEIVLGLFPSALPGADIINLP
jgi:hypothetical protein